MRISSETFHSITKRAQNLGFPEMGAARANGVEQAGVFRSWVENGYHAGMKWFEWNLEKRLDPRLAFEEAESVLILISPYFSEPCSLGGHKLARYACGDDYHEVLKKKLKVLCREMQTDFPGSDFRVYVDSGPIAERYWAEQAGLGWIGKNGNLIHKRHGSYFFIACILTNLEFPIGMPHSDHCGTCRACMDLCPTQAIVQPGIVDSKKCISYLNIEHRGDFEEDTQLHGWVFGCDICQEVCPWNRKKPNWNMLDVFQPRESYQHLSHDEALNLQDDAFRQIFRKSPVKRTKLLGLQRNLETLIRDD